jgi:hypothetical protein
MTSIFDDISNPLDKWSHLVLVQKYYPDHATGSRNDYYQYFNGKKLRVSATLSGTSSERATYFTRGGTIGCTNTTGNNYSNFNFFKGSIDDVRIYNRAVPEDEILLLFNLRE